MIQCNEAMLVDSMIPLDKIMVSTRLTHTLHEPEPFC